MKSISYLRKRRVLTYILVGAEFFQNVKTERARVTEVTGEGWLHHPHWPFDDTSMGNTRRLGPLDQAVHQATSHMRTAMLSSSPTSRSQVETPPGSDPYSLSCHGCHGDPSLGAPPGIGSLIDAVRPGAIKTAELTTIP
jgi:hypothetical protein